LGGKNYRFLTYMYTTKYSAQTDRHSTNEYQRIKRNFAYNCFFY